MAENLESSRTWSVYYSGPKGQRNRPSGSKVIDDFVVRIYVGTLQKTTSFSKSSSHGAAHPSRACRNMRFSTQTFVANLLPYIYLAPSVQKMRPIEDWMPPSAAGKDASVGEPRATYARATAHLRCALPLHMHNKRLRLIDCALIFAHSRVLGARLDQSASGQRRMHGYYTVTLGWNTCNSPT